MIFSEKYKPAGCIAIQSGLYFSNRHLTGLLPEAYSGAWVGGLAVRLKWAAAGYRIFFLKIPS